MIISRIKLRAVAVGLALAAAAPGCGSSGLVRVSGKVVKGGAAFVCSADRTLGVTLIAMDVKDEAGKAVAAGEPYPAEVNPADSTFVVPGPGGSGIRPGRYRVALIQKPTAAAVLSAQEKAGKKKTIRRDTDFFQNRFSAANSPIVRDLKVSCELVIDLDHPTEERVGDAR